MLSEAFLPGEPVDFLTSLPHQFCRKHSEVVYKCSVTSSAQFDLLNNAGRWLLSLLDDIKEDVDNSLTLLFPLLLALWWQLLQHGCCLPPGCGPNQKQQSQLAPETLGATMTPAQ